MTEIKKKWKDENDRKKEVYVDNAVKEAFKAAGLLGGLGYVLGGIPGVFIGSVVGITAVSIRQYHGSCGDVAADEEKEEEE